MKLAGKPSSTAGGVTTKKLTFIESQRSLRSELMRAVKRWSPTAKLSSSPSFQPRRSAIPCSTDTSFAFGSNQRPATTVLCEGSFSI